jgi:hypothetical protein
MGFPDHHASTIKLDCTLLVMAGIGVYVYGMFSIMASIFAFQDGLEGISNLKIEFVKLLTFFLNPKVLAML